MPFSADRCPPPDQVRGGLSPGHAPAVTERRGRAPAPYPRPCCWNSYVNLCRSEKLIHGAHIFGCASNQHSTVHHATSNFHVIPCLCGGIGDDPVLPPEAERRRPAESGRVRVDR